MTGRVSAGLKTLRFFLVQPLVILVQEALTRKLVSE